MVMLRFASRIMSRLMVSVIVAPAAFAVVWMLPPRVMRFPAKVKALLLPPIPVLLKLMPAKSGSTVPRLFVVMFWTLPLKTSAVPVDPVDGMPSGFQLAPVFQKPLPPPPSQVLPAMAGCEARSATMAKVSGKERRAVERRVRDRRVFISKIVS